MKAMRLCCVLLVMFFSCDDSLSTAAPDDPADPANDSYPAPKNITVSVSQSQVELSWEAARKATGYEVSYGTSAAYGYTEGTLEPRLSIPGLNIDGTWYFAVQAKYGGIKSPLPSNPAVVLKGGVVISGTGQGGKKEPEQGYTEQGPFDSAGFAAEKDAWEAQGIKSYRFTSKSTYDHRADALYVHSTVYHGKEPELILEPDDPEANFISQSVRTIDDLYSFIELTSKENYLKFVTRYNKQYHYPEYYLPTMGPEFDGGWFIIEVTSFEPLDDQ